MRVWLVCIAYNLCSLWENNTRKKCFLFTYHHPLALWVVTVFFFFSGEIWIFLPEILWFQQTQRIFVKKNGLNYQISNFSISKSPYFYNKLQRYSKNIKQLLKFCDFTYGIGKFDYFFLSMITSLPTSWNWKIKTLWAWQSWSLFETWSVSLLVKPLHFKDEYKF